MIDKIKLAHDIVDIVFDINGGAVSRKGKGHPTAFVDYSGHVNCVSVRIYDHGWVVDTNADFAQDFWFDFSPFTEEELDEQLLTKFEKLKVHADLLRGNA